MAESPGPVARLDQYLATVTLAHEAMWQLRRRLIGAGRDDDRVHRLFGEAAELAVGELSRLLREPRRLRDIWAEQELLDPDAATQTAAQLAAELERIEPSLMNLRSRQNEIARELRRLADDGP